MPIIEVYEQTNDSMRLVCRIPHDQWAVFATLAKGFVATYRNSLYMLDDGPSVKFIKLF